MQLHVNNVGFLRKGVSADRFVFEVNWEGDCEFNLFLDNDGR